MARPVAVALLLPALSCAFSHGFKPGGGASTAYASSSAVLTRVPLVTPKLAGAPCRASKPAMTVPALAVKLGVDVASAGITALAVAPLLAAFDEAITRSAAGGNLWQA